jgi:hypothetical protein
MGFIFTPPDDNDRLRLPLRSPPRNREAGQKIHRTTATPKRVGGASCHHCSYDPHITPTMPALLEMVQLGVAPRHILPK